MSEQGGWPAMEAKIRAKADELRGPDGELDEEAAVQWLNYWDELRRAKGQL